MDRNRIIVFLTLLYLFPLSVATEEAPPNPDTSSQLVTVRVARAYRIEILNQLSFETRLRFALPASLQRGHLYTLDRKMPLKDLLDLLGKEEAIRWEQVAQGWVGWKDVEDSKWAALKESLDSTTQEERLKAIYELGPLSDPRIYEILGNVATSPHLSESLLAARLLTTYHAQTIGFAPYSQTLAEGLIKKIKEGHSEKARVRLLGYTQRAEAALFLADQLKQRDDLPLVWRFALAATDRPEAVAFLTQQIQEGARWPLAILRTMDTRRTKLPLLDLARQSPIEKRHLLMDVLQGMEDPAIIELFRPYLNSTVDQIYLNAQQLLIPLGDSASITHLQDRMESGKLPPTFQALRLLAITGGPRSFELLKTHARSSDPQIAKWSILAMDSLKEPTPIKFLTSLWQELKSRPNDQCRPLIISGLARFEDKEAADILKEACLDEDESTQSAALKAIGALRAEWAWDWVDHLFAQNPEEAFLFKLLGILEKGRHPKANSYFQRLMESKESKIRQGLVMQARFVLPADEIRKYQSDPAPWVRADLASGIKEALRQGLAPTLQDAEILLQLSKDQRAIVRASAAAAMANILDDRITPRLNELCQDEDTEVRWSALRALKTCQDPNGEPGILLGLRDANARNRMLAISICEQLRIQAPGFAPLIALLGDPDANVQIEALGALARLQAEQALPALLKAMAASESMKFRGYCLGMLGELGGPTHLPMLAKIMNSDAPERARAYESAKAILGRSTGVAEASKSEIEAALKKYEKNPAPLPGTPALPPQAPFDF